MSAQSIQLSGLGSESLAEALRLQLVSMKPKALGIASAFVSVRGVREVLSITRRAGRPDCRLLAGISHAVTHPEALNEALDAGWDIRLGANPTAQGIFHPKLIVAGGGFDKKGNVESPSFAYVGSSNLTYGGLRINVECGLLATETACPSGVSASFAELWRLATPVTDTLLRRYAEEFAARNRRRAVEDIEALGIADSVETDVRSYAALRRARGASSRAAIPTTAARAAWAGLESFTGEYRFQVEFPRAAGEVLRDLVGGRGASSNTVHVHCLADGQTRDMQYRFYADNAMFRLNIPNDVPGVARAKRERNGIALVEATRKRGARVQLTILPPGEDANRAVRRSVALGTWGQTPTRLYGWY